MPSLQPLNLQRWIEEHRAFLKPPVGNKRIFRDSEFIIMVVGGPNTRGDYHVDPAEEFFHQLQGDILLRTMQDGKSVDVPLIDIIRFGEDGLAHEHWGVVDMMTMMQQLGVVPDGPPA